MKNYLKLVNFEFNRCIKLYVSLIGLTIVSQLIAVFIESKNYINQLNEAVYQNKIPKTQFLSETGEMSMFWVVNNIWFLLPILISVTAVLFYSFYIWYVEWMGKNTFIYRLLMLPTSRMTIFWSKITTIALMIFGLVSIQLILLIVESQLLKLLVASDIRLDLSLQQLSELSYYLSLFMPQSFLSFIIYYGTGFILLFLTYTTILFERSFRLKGIMMGIGFSIVLFLVFLSPVIANDIVGLNWLYPNEIIITEIILGVLVIAISSWMSHYLLNKKVTV
ncbi:hypothetical protein LHA31_11295 [Carnobacterium viridans]|uniref:ABC-2 family transporter protein n=1 Tax=Carnobacterium viridans TaxID=174587 RepID=A0A1H0YJ41_9LACT|nr:hypothetical protein [Carnobacterium viridans]UDE95116.1 hypothetical protein LHA31_11295 [Carnobacterium viridans]SDQ14931.1 hypothetical protein SAMN04487752_0970 [Carnobacterium viridans]